MIARCLKTWRSPLLATLLATLLAALLLPSAGPAWGDEQDPKPTPKTEAPEPKPEPEPKPAFVGGAASGEASLSEPEAAISATPRLGGDVPPGLLTGVGEVKVEDVARKGMDVATRDDVGKAAEEIGNLLDGQTQTVNKATDGAKKGGGSVVGKALDNLNLFNTGVKALTYASEGDAAGAFNVLIKEGVKKTTGAVLQWAGSIVPGVGNVIGGTANEELNSRYIAPFLDRWADRARMKEAEKKLLGWDLPGDRIMDSRGNVRELPPDMYLDPGSGLIKRRSPAEQKARETAMRRAYNAEGRSQHPLSVAQRRLSAGKIDDKEFNRICRDWNKGQWRKAAKGGGSGALAPRPPRRGPVRQPPAAKPKEKLTDDEWHRRLNEISKKGWRDVAKARRELREAIKKSKEERGR